MKKRQLLFQRGILFALFSFILSGTYAAVIPYLAPLQSFGGTSANLSTFAPVERDFTLEVQGTAGTQISIAGGLITYTPTATGTIRFAQKNGIVYVYEGNVYKTSITPSYTINYATISDADAASNSANLLQNASFETAGSLISGTAYNFGTPWVTNVTATASGIRFTSATTGNVNGTWEIVWRGSGNSNYFAQPVSTTIKPNTSYRVTVKQIAGGNAYAYFNFGLGNTAGGMEYDNEVIQLGNTKNGTWNTTLKTTGNVSGTSYFTVRNTPNNTANSGSDPVAQFDYLALVEGTVSVSTPGITNVSSATYLEGVAYAPENVSINYSGGDYFDVTTFLINPSYETSATAAAITIPGWTQTNVSGNIQSQTNSPGTFTKNGNVYGEKYVASGSTLANGSIYQTISNIPNGKYTLYALAHAKKQSDGTFPASSGVTIYAGASYSTTVSTGADYSVSNIVVSGNSLEVGFKINSAATGLNWVGVDNFRLYYNGPVDQPSLTAPQTSVSLTTATNTATINLTGANLTSDVSITVPSTHITLSGGNVSGTSPNYTIALASANATNDITASWDKTANVSGSISFSSGSATKSVTVSTEDVETVAMAGITLSAGALNTAFAVGTTSYTLKAPADKSSVTVSATTTPSIGTVTNNATAVSASSPSVVLTGNSYNGNAHTGGYTVTWNGNYTFDDWDANGDVSSTDLSKPSTYGWKCINTTSGSVEELVWNNFGTQSNCRYRDANAGYTYNSTDYSAHRVLFIRWDAGGTTNRVFSYPVYLETCKTYNFTSKAAWNSNGSAPTITYRINSANDNTGTTYATGSAITGASAVLVDGNVRNITVPSSGVYFLTITSSTASLCAVTDLAIAENVTASLNLSKSSINLYHGSLSSTFVVTGNSLSSDISISAPEGITLSATGVTPGQNISISKTDAQCGVTVTATYDEAATIINGSITASSDALSQTLTINGSKDAGCFTPLYADKTNLVTEPYMNSLTAYSLSWGSGAVISSEDQYCGALSGKVSGVRAGSITYPLSSIWAPNSRYRIKAKVKVSSGSFNLNVSGWSGASADIVNTITNTSITYSDASSVTFDAGTWNTLDFRFTTGATINSGSQYFYFNNHTSNIDGVGYIDNIEMYAVPLVRVSAASVSMTTAANTAVIDVTGNNLAGDINLVAPAGITLSGTNVTGSFPNYVIALASANATNSVTATWDKNATINSGTITLSTSDGSDVTVSVSTSNVEISSIASVVIGTGGVLSPAFDAATTTYSIKAPADIASVTVTGNATSSAATISNNGSAAPITLGCTSYNGLNTTNYSFSWSNYTLDDWDANGSTDASLSIPTVYGWSSTNALTWVAANAAVIGTSRYFDFVDGVNGSNPTYTYNGGNYTGRLLMVRWDGGNLARVYGYPLHLTSGNTYQIYGKAAYNSNTTTPTITFRINSAKDNTGTTYASGSVLTSTAGLLNDFVVTNIEVPTTGVYYLTLTSDKESMCAVGDIELNSKVSASFTGSTDNTWSNAGNWSSTRTPLFGDDVTIPSGNITIDVNAKAHGVTVAAGAKLTVASGKSLNANSIAINSDATGTATFVNSGTATIASASVNQYLTTGRNWYISSPVTAATAANLLTGASKVYRYNEPTAAWVELAAGESLVPGKGYITQANATGAVNFSGNLNDGNVQTGVVRTLGATKAGFNLVGNPYPSYLSWKACYEDVDNAANAKVGSTIWYRTKNAAGSVYKFATYNALTNLGTAVEAGDIVTGNIPPMQAFWVKVEAGNETGTLTFKNSMRAHKGSQLQGDEQTYTDGRLRAPALQKVIRLQVASASNSDDAIIIFNESASNGLDQFDSYKMSNNTASIPEIYTTVASEDLVINGMNSYDYNTSLALGFKAGETNTYTISAPVVKNFDADTKIILVDESTGTQTDLTAGDSYTFTSDATTTTTRFSVLFKSASGTTDINPTNNLMNIYGEGKQIIVESNASAEKVYRLKIFNSTGQIICDQPVSNSHVSIDNLAGGVYVVKLNFGQTEKTVKAIVK